MTSTDFLKRLPYFAALTAGQMEEVLRQTKELAFARGELVFLEGEACQGLYVVKSGRVRVFKSSPEGREKVLLVAGPGDSFNDVPVFDGGPNPASGAAIEDSVLYLVPKKALLSLLDGCPPAIAILKLMATRLRHLTAMVEDLSFRTVVSRVAKLLLDTAVVEGGPTHRFTQDEMAAMVGSVRDVIGRALKLLQKEGAIKLEGRRILVIDADKLRDLA